MKKTKLNRSDLQFFPSERLSDNDDGGGLALGTPIKGVADEIFDPISSVAQINGGFFTRKLFAGVLRSDDEPLFGAFVALTKPPAHPATSYLLFYLLFKAHQFGESRRESVKRIENFSTASIDSKMTLLSVQPTGSKIIQAYQRVGESLPLVGDVYCLRQDKRGYPTLEQYIQVVKVDSETRTFYNPTTQKEFVRVVVKMQISQSLRGDFIGADYPDEGYVDTPAKIKETSVVDAGAYYGIKPITHAILSNTQTISVAGLMEKLVPTNQVETHLLDLSLSGDSHLISHDKAGRISINRSTHHYGGNITSTYTGNAIMPSSVHIPYGEHPITDKPDTATSGTLYYKDKAIGFVDYDQGLIQITADTSLYHIGSISFMPAGKLAGITDSTLVPISINNRGYSYVFNLPLGVGMGSLVVKYRSGGRTYTLKDDGTGAIKGNSEAHGSGSFNHKTGSVALSLGELPDVGSGILLTWANTATTFDRSNQKPKAVMILPLKSAADPASIRLNWHDNGEKSATVSANGKLTGDWSGRYNADKNRLEIDTDINFTHPNSTLDVSISYNTGEKVHQNHKAPLRDGQGKINLNLDGTGLGGQAGVLTGNIKPNTVKLKFNLLIEDYQHISEGEVYTRLVDPYKVLTDDGKGKLIDETGKEFGTIDYAQKKLSFLPDTTVKIPKARYTKTKIGEQIISSEGNKQQVKDIIKVSFAGYEYIDAGAAMPIDESAVVDVWFYDQTPTSDVKEKVASGVIEIDLLPHISEQVLMGSLNFSFANQSFYDSHGLLMMNLNVATGQAVIAGSVDYHNALVTLKYAIASHGYYGTYDYNRLTDWVSSGYAPVKLNSLISAVDINTVSSCAFITPTAPIRPQSLTIRATTAKGEQIVATSTADGKLKGKGVTGTIDYEYGVVSVQFGQWVAVTDAMQKDPSFNTADVVNGQVFKDIAVLAQSITYNAVSYSYLPINSSTIKIDTVRLPTDGRVPIFRAGDMILITSTQSQELGSSFTGGQVVQLERQNIDRLCLQDSQGKAVLATLWAYDLKAGTITFAQDVNLSGYAMPLVAKMTYEERNRVISTDIDGTLGLQFATRRDYPIKDTYVSSVLIGDNLKVRATVPFTQRAWTNVWQDKPIGETLLNRLNVKDYPIVLTDDGAISERWLIKFTSSNQFEVYGETIGFVQRADTLSDLAPINPATNKPYFTIPRQAFGSDTPWSSQDVIRFDTFGTLLPFWIIQAVQPTATPIDDKDGFSLCVFGDTVVG